MRPLRSSSVAVCCLLSGLLAARPQPLSPAWSCVPQDATRPLDGETIGEAAYHAVLAKVAAWQRRHPTLVRRVDIGSSTAGRPLFVLRIGPASDGVPEVYLGAGIHGNEGSELDVLWLVDRLLAAANEPAIAELLQTRVLWVQPLVNPDGVVAHQRQNSNGVDLNRNFSARWQAGGRPEHDYGGTTAFSEVETCAVRDFLTRRIDLRAYLDFHRSAALLVPAQTGDDGTIDKAVHAAATALNSAMGNYSAGGTDGLTHFPGMHGLSIDWVWSELGVVAFTMENSGDAFHPAEQDPRWLGLLHLLENAVAYPASHASVRAGSYPVLVTDRTHVDPVELARLTHPGAILFTDGFESEASFPSYFEIGGREQGRARIEHEAEHVHRGSGSLQLSSLDSGGASCGAGPVLWLGDEGHDCVHMRYWIRYAPDYDQGNLHHTGGWIAGVAGNNKWFGMGKAGLRPAGDDYFSSSVEGWRDWQRVPAPGFLHCYTYWTDMHRDRDGNFWGNMLGPADVDRLVPARGKWLCVEQRVVVNTPSRADGELAVWIDGTLYVHYRGFRWRSSDTVSIKRVGLQVYVHEARRSNHVWFDDLVISTGYVGTGDPASQPPK